MKNSTQSFFSEMIGTFFLTSIVLISLTPASPFPLPTPIAASLTLALFVYLIGNISGCHINPAITIAMLVMRQITIKKSISYITAQAIGALLALFFITLFVPENQESWLKVSEFTLSSGVSEIIGTAFFAFSVFSAAYNNINKNMIGIVIGAGLMVGVTISHNSSYGVLNPAVALATKAWNLDYLLMPFIGGIIGSTISAALFRKNKADNNELAINKSRTLLNKSF